MLFVSFADACRRLSIDAKTLRRWLTEAGLSLHCHPVDGRKKGVSEHHLQMLARVHHRLLTDGEKKEEPVPLPALPAPLLTLPEQLATMQAQLATLHQQVAALSSLLTDLNLEPLQKLPALTSHSTAKPSAQPTRSAVRSRPAGATTSKAPAKPVHVIPRVEYREEGQYAVICPKSGLLSFEPETEEWFAWVKEQDSFRFVGKGGYFTAHHEWRVPGGAWRAHRKIRNHSYNVRLTPNHELTIAVLEQAAEALQAHLM